ncbi:MAG TPA: rhomboid family intramembrane serine protease [Bryobacteraceae bacterium]|jgi:membrane associated rhomboid family serine protease|nr:rhomboid family intramembrane serine protease [Bryobacteraceae bacterium]
MFPIRDTEPSYSKPVVTIFLIVINILIFLFEFSLDPYSQNAFIATYGLVPDNFHFVNVLTSMFLHGGWMHVLGNMWFLWIFGDNIEDILGHGKYIVFYLLCGIAAGLTQTLFSPGSRVPMVGASGAIAGVMGAYMIKFPQSRIRTLLFIVFFITFVDVPAWVMLIYWFGIQLLNGVGTVGSSAASQGGTAFLAHVGGFVTGIVLINLMRPQQRYMRRKDLSW